MPKMRILDTLCLDFNGIVKFFRRTRLRLFNPWREKYGLDIQLINYGHPAWLSILTSRSGYHGPAVKPRASVHRAAGYDRGGGLGRDTASCEVYHLFGASGSIEFTTPGWRNWQTQRT